MMKKLASVNKIVYQGESRFNLEQWLVSEPVFRENGLLLYCGVWVQDMIPAMEGVRLPDDSQAHLPYLVCREDQALLSFEWVPASDGVISTQLDGLLHLRVSDEENEEAIDLLSETLEQVLNQGSQPVWRYWARSIPQELRPALEREQMIANRGLSTLPTQYGAYQGVIRGYRASERSCRPHCYPICSDRALVHLTDLLDEQESAIPEVEPKQIPFARRIQRLNSGLYSGAYNAYLVRRFADTPLEVYMGDCPAELEQLRDSLYVNVATYQQAAAAIYKALQIDSESKESLKALCLLAQPLIRRFSNQKPS